MTALEKAKEALQRIADEGTHDTLQGRSLIDGSVMPSQHIVTKSAQLALDALAAIEAEKPSESAKRTAVPAWRSNDHPGGLDWVDSAAVVIQSFADAKLSKERERAEGLAKAIKGLLDPENDGDESYRVAYAALAKYQEEGE